MRQCSCLLRGLMLVPLLVPTLVLLLVQLLVLMLIPLLGSMLVLMLRGLTLVPRLVPMLVPLHAAACRCLPLHEDAVLWRGSAMSRVDWFISRKP